MDPVLVAFATRNGSTGEVAEALAATLRKAGWATDLAPIADRPSVSGRSLVIVGAPLYSGRWMRAARRFLKNNRSALGHTKVAVFGMGPCQATEDAFARSRAQIERALAKLAWLNPVRTAVFGGADPPKKNPRRDARDWGAIENWGIELAGTLAAPTDHTS